MVYLLFQIGADRYALEAGKIFAVEPLVRLKKIPQVPPGIAGVINYHGQPVPVVDLTAMALGRSGEASLSTRLIVLHYDCVDGETRLLGLLAEKAVDTAQYKVSDFQDSGVLADGAPYLGPVVRDARGIIQRVEIECLLTTEVRDVLWQRAREAL